MAAPSLPDDTKDVVCASRLGWAVAEVRARYQGRLLEPVPTASQRGRVSTFLPLAKERSPAELAIESEAVVAGLAKGLGLDFDLTQLSDETEQQPRTASDRLEQPTRGLADGDVDQLVPFGHLLYAWDAKIQDTLAAGSFGQATGYLLGRGLGEVSWGPELAAAAGEPGNWSAFLGPVRRAQLVQSLERLSAYFDPLTAVAVRSSLMAWQGYEFRTPAPRSPTTGLRDGSRGRTGNPRSSKAQGPSRPTGAVHVSNRYRASISARRTRRRKSCQRQESDREP